MGQDALSALLDVRLFQALDIDEAGRILAAGDDTGSSQLIEIGPDGAVTPVTALPGPCSGRYVPGQRAVLVSHDEGGNERHQISLLRLPRPAPASEADLEPVCRDPRYLHTLADVRGQRFVYLTNRRNDVDFDPVIASLADGTERTLRVGDRRFAEAVLSPDERWLAVTISSPVTANAEHVALIDLSQEAGHEQLRDLTPPDAPALNHSLCFAPGSDALYVSSNNDREFTAIARYDLATGERHWLVTDDEADLAGWLSPDGSRVLVERNVNGRSELAVHDAATGHRLRDVAVPAPGCLAQAGLPVIWAPSGESAAFTFTGTDLPSDVVVTDLGDRPASVLTHSARGLRGQVPVGPEEHFLPAADGQRIPCLVYRPPDATGSAVLLVHGGPEGQSRQGFSVQTQLLAAAGHAVLVPNVRGSTGYGKRWYSADDGRLRLDAVADLAALHASLAGLGLDPARAALWGGSYGGYMVLAGLAFQPDLWAAGVDIVGIASFVTFLENTSAYRRAYREREYGTLANDRAFLAAASPLSHIDAISAPLFIIHGANDPRVPLSEAEQIHAALTSRGQDCQLLVYGDEGHGLARRANRLDAYPKACEFLARHLAAR